MCHEGGIRGPNTGQVSDRSWGEVDKSKLPAGCHAYAGNPNLKRTWVLPHHEGAGGVDPETQVYREVGPLNRGGVHNAAARFNQVDWGEATEGTDDSPAEARRQAARHLQAAYRYMDEDTPEVIADAARGEEEDHEAVESTALADVTSPRLTREQALAMLAVINERHAREPLTLGQVYMFPGEMSNQHVDSYGTRMTAETLANYKADALAGVPLMDSHRTPRRGLFGGGSDGELPIGRSFDANLSGKPVGFDDGQIFSAGQRLVVWHYMLRSSNPNGRVPVDEYIRGIEAGVFKSLSIGFRAEWYRCSLCGRNYLSFDCPHLALVTYDPNPEEDFQGGLCYAWVEDGHLVEDSLVYSGATPEAMVRKARTHLDRIDKPHVELLEAAYRTRLRSPVTYSIPPETLVAAEQEPTRYYPEPGKPADGSDRVEQADEVAVPRDQVGELRDELEATRRQVERLTSEKSTLLARLRERDASLEEASTEIAALRAQIEALTPRARLGDLYLDDLVEQAVAARVRAQGSGFDAGAYRTMLRGQGVDYVKSEIEAHEANARATFQPGRPTRRAQAAGRLTASPERALAHLYRVN